MVWHHFTYDSSKISAPLFCPNDECSEEEFQWISEAERNFQQLKSKLVETLVLALPDFLLAIPSGV